MSAVPGRAVLDWTDPDPSPTPPRAEPSNKCPGTITCPARQGPCHGHGPAFKRAPAKPGHGYKPLVAPKCGVRSWAALRARMVAAYAAADVPTRPAHFMDRNKSKSHAHPDSERLPLPADGLENLPVKRHAWTLPAHRGSLTWRSIAPLPPPFKGAVPQEAP